LEIADAAGASTLVPRIYAFQALCVFLRGEVAQGFALLERARDSARANGDEAALLRLAVNESDALLKTGKFASAAEVARRGLEIADRTGRYASFEAIIAASNGAEALIAMGRTAEAASLIDPLTTGTPDRDRDYLFFMRVELDLLRGELAAATRRQRRLDTVLGRIARVEMARENAQRAAELALWAGRLEDAMAQVRSTLARHETRDLTVVCGRLLVAGMRACGDMAEQSRAKRDDVATRRALAAADELAAWVDEMGGAPFIDHPFVATIPAERATWEAERTRLSGASDPTAWHAAAKTWEDLECPHRAGYAWWRHAEARLLAGQPPPAAAVALRVAAGAAHGHAPLLAAIHALADRAHIRLDVESVVVEPADSPEQAAPFGLSGRELAVLRLVAAGQTNAQIGAELFISPKTAGVHVSNILRKLRVSTRVQAAAVAERAGLLQRR
jgi:ATP/maltotriose-dependent transcriptional regulator MalT